MDQNYNCRNKVRKIVKGNCCICMHVGVCVHACGRIYVRTHILRYNYTYKYQLVKIIHASIMASSDDYISFLTHCLCHPIPTDSRPAGLRARTQVDVSVPASSPHVLHQPPERGGHVPRPQDSRLSQPHHGRRDSESEGAGKTSSKSTPSVVSTLLCDDELSSKID